MGYGDNKLEYEAGAPKKADVLIRSTQHIALKQDEMSEQTKLVASRLDEAIELFTKNNQDASYIVKQSGEIFSQLQGENSALKQELLYLAKQSENIYAGLAEKITELSDQAKVRDDAMTGLADKINDVAEQTSQSGNLFSDIIDKLAELTEQNKRNEKLFESLSERLDKISEHAAKNEKAYGELSDKINVADKSEPVEIDNTEVLKKIAYVSDQLRRAEGAHSMLADKFEILSMRVEQFGFESAKSAPAAYAHPPVQPVAYPAPVQPVPVQTVPVQTVVKEEIDYDKLAGKIASLISAREVISPDYIASKVAEQIVIPETSPAVNVSVDYDRIARQVTAAIDAHGVKVTEVQPTPAAFEIDEEGLAAKLADRLAGLKTEELAPACAVPEIDEDSLAEKIAEKLGGFKPEVAAVSAGGIDEEELADAISIKVGSLKAEDFEILVDDEGCGSISKGIADNLNYEMISNIIADKLRDALDLSAANAPDYEEMAERISEKITVAGVNEDAIADKAAAVLSNYLPDLDTDEIADKITGAVIDVVCAMPQPTVDSDAICNSITEKLIESQEDHDYDIVIDDEGITRITELVTEEIEKGTGARFDKVEEDIAKLTELLTKPEEIEEETKEADSAKEAAAEDGESAEDNNAVEEKDFTKLTELMAAEIEKSTYARFDKVEEDIAKLTEIVTNAVTEVESEDGYDGEYEVEEDYSALSEVVAAEIEKGVASRFDSVEENISKLTEIVTNAVTEVESEDGYEGEYEVEEDYSAISEVVAAEIERGVAARFDSVEENISKVEENISKLAELVTNAVADVETEDGYDVEDVETVEEYDGEYEVEEDYTAISEVVATEIEKAVAVRLDSLEQNIAKLTELISADDTDETAEEDYQAEEGYEEEYVEEDYTALSEVVAAEIEKAVAARLDSVEDSLAGIKELLAGNAGGEVAKIADSSEDGSKAVAERLDSIDENITKITELIENGFEVQSEEATEEDYTELSEAVKKALIGEITARFDSVDENVAKLCEFIENGVEVEGGVQEVNHGAISEAVTASVVKELSAQLDAVEENVAKISEILQSGAQPRAEGEEVSYVSEKVAEDIVNEVSKRLDGVEANVAKITELVAGGVATEVVTTKVEEDYSAMSEVVAAEIDRSIASRLDGVEQSISRISEIIADGNAAAQAAAAEVAAQVAGQTVGQAQDGYTGISELVAAEIDKGLSKRFDKVEEDIARISQLVNGGVANNNNEAIEGLRKDIDRISEKLDNGGVANANNEAIEGLRKDIDRISEKLENGGVANANNEAIEGLRKDIDRISEKLENGGAANANNEAIEGLRKDIDRISEKLENGERNKEDSRLDELTGEIAQIKEMIAGAALNADNAAEEVAAAQAVAVEEVPEETEEVEEEALVTVSDVVKPESETGEEEFEEDEEEEDDGDDGLDDDSDDFTIDVLDMDRFSDNELMPGEMSDYTGGVDFANMMKFKRSFIARIIQSSDEYKQYYGEVKHALLSYKKVNSNVAWGAERFNKGRETIARMKIRGKTLCLYLALDPNEFKTSVYHHLDVSDNKSVAGTPMMVKIRSNLGVRKAIRLIDAMLAQRNGEKKEIPERDYAAMYPYETIEELIEDGLVKDVRKK